MDATCAIQASIHVFSLVRKYVSRILGTYQFTGDFSVSRILNLQQLVHFCHQCFSKCLGLRVCVL